MTERAFLLCAGGTAGVAAWLSVYPLDVLKARVQATSAAQTQHAGEPSLLASLHRHSLHLHSALAGVQCRACCSHSDFVEMSQV